ncbi:MAG: hypothetical protein ACRC7F_01940 [Cetobacterium sp.]|uniref:hypothetical protein n=1 Tax=unclassified Cetobacterium TaxID=2630983 RepID=UPI000646AAF9|nr:MULTISPECIES: hypothetical protein [unclassified Cetobacterium]
MYKVELFEHENILISRELEDYDSTFSYLEVLIKELGDNRKIIVHEKRDDRWVKFGEWKLQ